LENAALPHIPDATESAKIPDIIGETSHRLLFFISVLRKTHFLKNTILIP
jgi:hypothetical protein